MAQIYGMAEGVLAWLGPESDNSDAVMDAFRVVGAGAEELDMFSYYTRDKIFTLLDTLRESSPDPANKTAVEFRKLADKACNIYRPILRSMGSWFSRDYFTRIWVVQGFALGTETSFLCGHERVSRGHVVLAMQIFQNSDTKLEDFNDVYKDVQAIMDEPASALFGAWRRSQKFMQGTGDGDELFHLLRSKHTKSQLGTSDGRDRVYGLMGLAVDVDKLGLKPDYANLT